MKAYELLSVGNLKLQDVPYPTPLADWCVVRVRACGICSSDIPRIFKRGTYHFPTIPGHEISGIVDSVCNQTYRNLVGKRVAVFPLIPCRNCRQCAIHHYEMCEKYDYIGSRRDGGFSQFVAVPIWNLVFLPDEVSLIQGAELEPLAVAIHAVKKCDLTPQDRLAIIGTGIIALSAAIYASHVVHCASVTVIGRSETKRHFVNQLGPIDFFPSALEKSNRFTKVIEAVGSNESLVSSIDICESGGQIVLLGNPARDNLLKQNDYWKILRKQLTLIGSWNSSYPDDWQSALTAFRTPGFNPETLVTHLFNASDLPRGLDLMRSHQEPYIKVMTLWNEK